jgi:hypothetical protein
VHRLSDAHARHKHESELISPVRVADVECAGARAYALTPRIENLVDVFQGHCSLAPRAALSDGVSVRRSGFLCNNPAKNTGLIFKVPGDGRCGLGKHAAEGHCRDGHNTRPGLAHTIDRLGPRRGRKVFRINEQDHTIASLVARHKRLGTPKPKSGTIFWPPLQRESAQGSLRAGVICWYQ